MLKNGRRSNIRMKTPPPKSWSGHYYFNIIEYKDSVRDVDREFIGIHTSSNADISEGGIGYIPKDSILDVCMFLFELAKREGLTESKEDKS